MRTATFLMAADPVSVLGRAGRPEVFSMKQDGELSIVTSGLNPCFQCYEGGLKMKL